MRAALLDIEKRSFEMNAERFGASRFRSQQRSQAVECRLEDIRGCRYRRWKERCCAVTGERFADGVHRVPRCIHHVESRTPVDMRINEAGNQSQFREFDPLGAVWHWNVRENSHRLDAIAANKHAARRELFERSEYSADVESKHLLSIPLLS